MAFAGHVVKGKLFSLLDVSPGEQRDAWQPGVQGVDPHTVHLQVGVTLKKFSQFHLNIVISGLQIRAIVLFL